MGASNSTNDETHAHEAVEAHEKRQKEYQRMKDAVEASKSAKMNGSETAIRRNENTTNKERPKLWFEE
jgi:hypothetical protein